MKIAIVVKDAARARDQEIERSVHANLKQRPHAADHEARLVRRQLEAAITLRQEGDLHALMDDDSCPAGLPNCRNCGDPDHADACRAAGHCPLCGTAHGIAPDAHIVANGYEMVVVDDQKPGEAWDRATKKFKK